MQFPIILEWKCIVVSLGFQQHRLKCTGLYKSQSTLFFYIIDVGFVGEKVTFYETGDILHATKTRKTENDIKVRMRP